MSEKEKKEKKKFGFWKKCLITLLIGIVVGIGVSGIYIAKKYGFKTNHGSIFDSEVKDEIGNSEQSDESDESAPSLAQKASSNSLSPVSSSDVSAIVSNAMPSVVSISCTIVQHRNDLFGYGRTYESEASGSGFIIGQNNKEILIATNNHVVSDANNISIAFIDGSKAEATVKGTDSYYDLAVVAVDIDKVSEETIGEIRIATLGSSENVKVGSMAIAIGNSLGYGQSTTVGYISAIDRNVKIDNHEMELIQTDTAINPGNSGGPLLNVYGEVIGINSSKSIGTEVEGMGYCIPISKAIPVINELMNRVELADDQIGYLGIKGKDISADSAKSFNMPVGIYVSEVEENSPAEQAEIYVGDIITNINGRKVSSMEELRSILSYSRAGTEIVLTVSTNTRGKYVSRDITVKLVNRPTANSKNK